jgi:hypothetical protein
VEVGRHVAIMVVVRCSASTRKGLDSSWRVAGDSLVADEITVSAPCERVDLEALKATKARRKGAER